jgi:hypothetical protein
VVSEVISWLTWMNVKLKIEGKILKKTCVSVILECRS